MCIRDSYLLALLLIGITILLWQAPTLIQRHLPGWLATHYGLHLSLGKIEVGIRSPSLVLGPSALLDDKQQALVSFEELKLIPALKASWQQRALVLDVYKRQPAGPASEGICPCR